MELLLKIFTQFCSMACKITAEPIEWALATFSEMAFTYLVTRPWLAAFRGQGNL
jgi:hypothetical protein